MDRFKTYITNNFEQIFALLILVTVFTLNYFLPHKIAFLGFYFLPVIIAGYYLGLRSSVLGAFLCILLITIYVIYKPEQFLVPSTIMTLYFHIVIWGGFLILAGAIVGKLHMKLMDEIAQTRMLNGKLEIQQESLNKAHTELKDYSTNLEIKVNTRTVELRKSKEAIESLKNKVEDTLYSTMDATVAKLIIEGRLTNEKRRLSVMFTDLVNFTEYSEERTPELVIRDLNRYLNDMEPIILSYKGHIDKYMGDGIMVEFGAPMDYDQYRLLAVLTALKMQQKMRSLDYPWPMRIGIASGTTIMGLIGARRQSYTTIGDTVNLASRLEKACTQGSVYIDEKTLEGVRYFVEYHQRKTLHPLSDNANRIEEEFDMLHQEVEDASEDKDRVSACYQLGKLHEGLGEVQDALSYYKKALDADPENVELKVAFAEATIKAGKDSELQVKGRKKREAVYEVTGIKDPLLDRKKFSAEFYKKYSHLVDTIPIPDDVILPVEAIDGCIGHSRAVAVMSFAIATELGCNEQEVQEIFHAAYVADIGKEIIPHHILNRSDTSLSATELEIVEKHPVESVRLLRKMGYNSELMLHIVCHSHEHFDGSGCPGGLRGEAIPLGSRIVAVADTYDALTSWRPYRDSWNRDAAFDELGRGVKNGYFDPKVVETLKKMLA
jgi:HD-GYP domain-containing protein (c-di-GMP phosphodiesterase class II)